MKALVITKAVYDYIMPLVEYPKDGDTFYINETINSVTNVGSMSAITLGKYGVDVNVTSIVGEDEVADKACQRAGEKACLRPKGYRCNDDNSRAGLEVWQWDNGEYCAPHNGNGCHHRNGNHLAGLGLLLVEYQNEGYRGSYQEQQAQQDI